MNELTLNDINVGDKLVCSYHPTYVLEVTEKVPNFASPIGNGHYDLVRVKRIYNITEARLMKGKSIKTYTPKSCVPAKIFLQQAIGKMKKDIVILENYEQTL